MESKYKKFWNESKASQENEQFAETKAQFIYRKKKTGLLMRKAIDSYREEKQSQLSDIEIVKLIHVESLTP